MSSQTHVHCMTSKLLELTKDHAFLRGFICLFLSFGLAIILQVDARLHVGMF
jgi:hypothetical protein